LKKSADWERTERDEDSKRARPVKKERMKFMGQPRNSSVIVSGRCDSIGSKADFHELTVG
jgi:hypothetical protein